MAERGVSRVVVGLSLEEQLSKFPAELLDRPCAESVLGKLVHHIITDTMVLLATDLGLSDVEVEDIQEIWPKNPVKHRLEMFKKWQQKNTSQATYRWVWLTAINLTTAYKLISTMHKYYVARACVHVCTCMRLYPGTLHVCVV